MEKSKKKKNTLEDENKQNEFNKCCKHHEEEHECCCHNHDCDENKTCCCGENENETCECQHDNKEAVYLEALQRTMAEFDNYRKRTAVSNEKSREDGVCQAISAILPSVDALDKAIEMCEGNKQVEAGLKLVKDNILTSFKNLGLTEIEALNKPFDPNLHNAVMASEEEGVESGLVLEEFQKGYKLGDRVVRYTMCKVSK